MPKAFNEPLGVVAVEEVLDDPSRLRQALEPVQIDALLFERPHEALDDPVALGLAHVGRRDRDPEPLHLVDPSVGDILRAPVAPDLQPARDVLTEPVEGVAGTLPNRLEGGPAIAELGHVPAEQLVGVMVDRPEEPAPAVLLGVEPRGVCPPHLIRARRDDRAGVGGIAIGRPQPSWRQEVVLPHQPQDSLAPHRQPTVGQAGPDLSVALPMERRLAQDGTYRDDEVGIIYPRLGPAFARRGRRDAGRGGRVDTGARHAPDVADHRQRVAPVRARTDRGPHRRDLFHSSVSPLFSMRCSASSSRIINSPIFARARVSSRSSGSARVLRPRAPVSRNTRFHLSSSWAGIWLSRETVSSASPRSRRSTNSVLPCTLHRSGSSAPSFIPDSSARAAIGFRAFFPISASLVTTMISQTGVQGNRVPYTGIIRATAILRLEVSNEVQDRANQDR